MITALSSSRIISRLLCVGLFISCCAVCSVGWLSAANSLAAAGGRWLPEKIVSMRQPRFSFNHFLIRRAVPGNRLDLSFWNGAQKISFFKPLDCKRVVLDVELAPGAFAGILFGGHNGAFSGVMFGRNGLYSDMFFEMNSDGFFVRTQKIGISAKSKEQAFTVELLFKRDRAALFINGVAAGHFNKPACMIGKGNFGFIGGNKTAFVDNIRIFENSGNVVEENFSNKQGLWPLAIAVAGCVFVVVGLLVFVLRFFRFFARIRKDVLVNGVLFCLILVCLTVVVADSRYMLFNRSWFVLDPYGDFTKIAKSGPAPAAALEQTLPFEPAYSKRYLLKLIESRNIDEPPDSVVRIAVLGTSQTFGMGAGDYEHAFCAVMQKWLNKKAGLRCRVFNYGLAGSFSGDIADLYVKEWIKKKPDICIINLSNNDFRGEIGLERKTGVSAADFALNLEKIVKVNEAENITTVFCLEANSPEVSPDGLEYHKVMVELAKRKKIQIIDLHLSLKDKIEQGILWWDHVHMTRAGHKLAGWFIAQEILPAVEKIRK